VPAFNPYGLKPWFTQRLAAIVRAADRHNISPDVFTLVGVAGALIGAVVLALPGFGVILPIWLSMVLIFVFGLVVRLGGANLDGAVARARGVSKPTGFVLNELGDRVSDLLLFFGLYLGADEVFKPLVVLGAMIASIPTLVSVAGAAVGVSRINGGPFGKTERSIVFVLFAGTLQTSVSGFAGVAFIVLLCALYFGSAITSLQRYLTIKTKLEVDGTSWRDDQPTVIKGSGSK